jgi:hypothetical protein
LKKEEELDVYLKSSVEARHQWFTPVNLATWEAEIRRIVV